MRWLRGHPVATRLAIVLVALLVAAGAAAVLDGRDQPDPAVTHADRGLPYVALTFDDGLNGATTSAVADLLEQYDMRGTFFVVGQTLDAQVALARQLMERGHLIGNHSYDHVRADPRDTDYSELQRAEIEFKRTIDVCPRLFRPPFGAETPFTKAAVRRAGMRTVLWDVEVADWSETDPARLASHVLEAVRPGSIVLLHDGSDGQPGADRSVLLAALPTILAGLRDRGLQGVTVDRLLGAPGYLEAC